MDDPETLARFQAAFLEALADARDPHEAIARLRALEESAPYLAWIDGFEARGVETGMELVRQWGARRYEAREGTMRGTVLEAIGAPLRDRELPLRTPGPGQARIRVRACGVCGTDVHAWQGRFRVPLPIVLGHEAVGEIDAVGEGVDLAIGDRVGVPWLQRGCGACEECARGREKYCPRQINWIRNGGGFAEHMIAEASACVPLPAALSFDQAAPLFCAGFTAMSGFRRARPQPGERIAVLGVGGLGHLAIQIARAHGHEVIAITRARAKQRDAIELGASEVLIAREHAGRELARIGGADVVISTTSDLEEAGGALLGLRNEGRLVVLGIGGPMQVDPLVLASKQAAVIGALQDRRADLLDLLDLAARGEVRPRCEPHRMANAQRVLVRLAEGRVRYRAVLI